MGISPISYQEIEAYARLMKVNLSMFDVQAIKMLDRVAISESSKE